MPYHGSTVIRLASKAALCLNASSILDSSSYADTRGLTVIRLLTPTTPVRYRTALSAAFF